MYLRLEEYERPGSVEACLEALGRPGAAALLAGGTALNVRGHEDLVRVVDLQGVGLRELEPRRLGARVTLSAITEAGPELGDGLAAVVEAAAAERNLPKRNRSTVGGRLCRDRADGRLGTALAAIGASVEVARPGGERQDVPIEDFLGRRWQEAERGRYVVLAVTVPEGVAAGRSGYGQFSLTAVDTPYADVALWVGPAGQARAFTGGHGPTAQGIVRAPAVERTVAELVQARAPGAQEPTGWEARLRAALGEELPAYTDARAGGAYRRDLTATLFVRLVRRLVKRLGSGAEDAVHGEGQ